MDKLEIGQRVVFRGYPSYLQGKKGRITKESEHHLENHFKLEFDDGAFIWVLPKEVELAEGKCEL